MNRAGALHLLGLSSDSDFEAIRDRFRLLANRYHPDRYVLPGDRAVATMRFQQISAAWTILQSAPSLDTSDPVSSTRPNWSPPSLAENERRVSAWDLVEPFVDAHPVVGFVLDTLWAPLLLPTSLVGFTLIAIETLFRNYPRTWNLLVSLNAHLIPGSLAILVGRRLIGLSELTPSLIGWWFVAGGTVFVGLELVAHAIGAWKLRRERTAVLPMREIA